MRKFEEPILVTRPYCPILVDEAPTRWVRALGCGLDVILYVGYVVYGALFLAAAKAKGWLSSPCKGIGTAFGLLGLGGEAGKCKAGGCE